MKVINKEKLEKLSKIINHKVVSKSTGQTGWILELHPTFMFVDFVGWGVEHATKIRYATLEKVIELDSFTQNLFEELKPKTKTKLKVCD